MKKNGLYQGINWDEFLGNVFNSFEHVNINFSPPCFLALLKKQTLSCAI